VLPLHRLSDAQERGRINRDRVQCQRLERERREERQERETADRKRREEAVKRDILNRMSDPSFIDKIYKMF
jgi:hypothetical protein